MLIHARGRAGHGGVAGAGCDHYKLIMFTRLCLYYDDYYDGGVAGAGGDDDMRCLRAGDGGVAGAGCDHYMLIMFTRLCFGAQGTAASLVLAVTVREHLWGLVVCHHKSRRFISYQMRMACEFLA